MAEYALLILRAGRQTYRGSPHVQLKNPVADSGTPWPRFVEGDIILRIVAIQFSADETSMFGIDWLSIPVAVRADQGARERGAGCRRRKAEPDVVHRRVCLRLDREHRVVRIGGEKHAIDAEPLVFDEDFREVDFDT